MENVIVTFTPKYDIRVDDSRSNKALIGYQEIRCHIKFDIKMDSKVTGKIRLVAGGRTTISPSSITYFSVVVRDNVQITFTIAVLNGSNCMSCNICNTYLYTPKTQKKRELLFEAICILCVMFCITQM